MRRAARIDGNHEAIVKTLRSLGASVQSLAQLGQGAPDLLVGWHGRLHLLEVKSEDGKVSAAQREWHARWPGLVRVVRSAEEAIAAVSR